MHFNIFVPLAEEEVIDLCLEEMSTPVGDEERRNVLATAVEKRSIYTSKTLLGLKCSISLSGRYLSNKIKQPTPNQSLIIFRRHQQHRVRCRSIPSSARSPSNDDKPSTSTSDVAGGSRTKIKVISGKGAANNNGNRTGGADSDAVEGDSQGEWSETLEYDASQPLFTDSTSEHSSQEIPSDAPRSLEGQQRYGKGTPISELNQAPACRAPLPDLKPSQNHTVLFRPYVRAGDPPRPFPDQYQDKWDAYHVRMPCSPENLYTVEDKY
ncbi:uncharacterized protein [Amphiura filiformis]|uniref:uncharacterized protein n=1 Tax=Amphiura filiformis TaxID=82378 RepID=UPI003B22289F